MTIRPFNKKIMVRKCVTGTEEVYEGRVYHRIGNVVVTELRANHQHWCEVLDVADDCVLFTKDCIGKFVWIPEFKPNHLYRIWDSEDFIIRESLFAEKDGAPALVVGD